MAIIGMVFIQSSKPSVKASKKSTRIMTLGTPLASNAATLGSDMLSLPVYTSEVGCYLHARVVVSSAYDTG